ncbi:hypothetical protein SPI_08781 [Niveomyces insectorum RCEF 264]|uniref:Uncharacterized protein n=1 Tax=Niveomyces insectorum RCEF 264 TaxID=1081102 RepID=A0A162IAU7_9HYPO|nr:hypothetical protein SPI_08781 [Niveomyces insectorum RCEF 264]
MADTIHGNGLFDVHEALERLAANTALLDRALQRFGGDGDDGPPPPYYPPSSDSGTTTQPESPPLPAPEARSNDAAARRIQREIDLGILHEQSRPGEQFETQSYALAFRLTRLRYNEQAEGMPFPPPRTNERARYVLRWLKEAEGKMRTRWREQGIWVDAWGEQPSHEDRWPHEDARGAEPGPGSPAAAAAPSRPYHQFVYQVAKERDLLLGLSRELDPPPRKPRKPWATRTMYWGRYRDEEEDEEEAAPPTVKAAWRRWQIWDPRWTVMPGLRWMHEEPLSAFIRRRLAEEDALRAERGDEAAPVAPEENAPGAPEPVAGPLPSRPPGFNIFGQLPPVEADREAPEAVQQQQHQGAPAGAYPPQPYPYRNLFGSPSPPQQNPSPPPPPPLPPAAAARRRGRPRGQARARPQPARPQPARPPPPPPPQENDRARRPGRPARHDAAPDEPSPPRRSKRLQAVAESHENEASPTRPAKRTRAANNQNNEEVLPAPARQTKRRRVA